MVTAISVAVGGALGSLARYGLAGMLNFRSHPWGTVTVNVIGSLILGVLLGTWGMRADGVVQTGLAIGLLGGFTTFSTFAFDTLFLWEHGDTTAAVLSVAVTLVFGIGAAVAGVAIGRSIS